MVTYGITKGKPLYESDINQEVEKMVGKVKERMWILFEMYKERFDISHLNQGMCDGIGSQVAISRGDNDFLNELFTNEETKNSTFETELQRYLNEPRIDFYGGFDILEWWRAHGPRFPIVALMARDILSIQISTVASESAFSTGGRVLDPYRTSLSSQIVEALICTKDRIRKEKMEINMDEVDDLLSDDEVAKEIEEAIRNCKGKQVAKH